MAKIDEATNPPNPKMHAWAKQRATFALTDGSPLSTYTYSCWHVVTTAHGGEFRALRRIFLGACRRKAATWRASLEIWYERTFQGKTDEDFDRECEETAAMIQSLYAAAVPAKLRAAKLMFQHQHGKRVEGVDCGDGSLRVYLRDEKMREGLPGEFMGYPVVYVVTGEVKAY